MTVTAGERPATLAQQDDFRTNRGGLCAKGWAATELLDSPERLLTPLVRDGRVQPLRPATWDEALDRVGAAIPPEPGGVRQRQRRVLRRRPA